MSCTYLVEDILALLCPISRVIVGNQLMRSITAIVGHWASQPRWYSCLLMLVAVMAFAGPVACLMHCMNPSIHEHGRQHAMPRDHTAAQHEQHGHQQPASGADLSPILPDPCASGMLHMPPGMHEEPTPLTIAIVIPALFGLFLIPIARRVYHIRVQIQSSALSPPWRPPCSLCSRYPIS